MTIRALGFLGWLFGWVFCVSGGVGWLVLLGDGVFSFLTIKKTTEKSVTET